MPMDLSQIFDQGQFSLIKPGMDAFNLDQQKQQATLQQLKGQEQRAQAMHPFEIDSKKAYTRQANAQAGTMEDRLKVLEGIPLPDRIAVGVAENKSKLTGAALQQADSEMEQLATLAAAALQNGGSLPLGMNVQNPEHAKYFGSPKGAALAAQISKAYFMAKPKELYAASNDERNLARAREIAKMTNERMAAIAGAKATPQGGIPPKMSAEQAMAYYNGLASKEPDPQKKAELQAEADRYELIMYRKAREAAAARQEGTPDLKGMGIETIQNPPPAPTPRAGATPPQPAAPTPKYKIPDGEILVYKNGKPVGTIPADQKAQAIAEGYEVR